MAGHRADARNQSADFLGRHARHIGTRMDAADDDHAIEVGEEGRQLGGLVVGQRGVEGAGGRRHHLLPTPPLGLRLREWARIKG
jgi:hypothetical protein